MRLIDADALMLHLADYQLQESPNWGANGYGNADRYEAITDCINAVDLAPTIDAVDKKVDAVGYCESCDWCEYEFVKSDGSEDKRYRNHKWCGLHERSTKKDGFCHWFLERLGEDDKN